VCGVLPVVKLNQKVVDMNKIKYEKIVLQNVAIFFHFLFAD